jgi:hypothetical protein
MLVKLTKGHLNRGRFDKSGDFSDANLTPTMAVAERSSSHPFPKSFLLDFSPIQPESGAVHKKSHGVRKLKSFFNVLVNKK